MRERVKKTKVSFPDVNMTKPVDVKEVTANIEDQDCFTFLWQPDDKLCAACADCEMCGIIYNHRLNKKVKRVEKEKGGYLDNMHFDSIDKDELLQWLRMKPRTTQQFVDKIAKFSECPDHKTVVYWCKSFIIETKGVSTKDGIVIVKP